MMKVRVRVHGHWEPGEELVIDQEPGADGIYDAFTPAHEAAAVADRPEPVVLEMELPEPEFAED